MTRTLYSNFYEDLNLDKFKEDYKDFLEEENLLDADEAELYELMYSFDEMDFDDFFTQCDIQLEDGIVVIADIGRWNGRASGYKVVRSGNVQDILHSDCDYAKWYVDSYKNLRFEGAHHDGRNYYLYRTWKNTISEEQKENFLDKIYEGAVTSRDITRYTKRIGDVVLERLGYI